MHNALPPLDRPTMVDVGVQRSQKLSSSDQDSMRTSTGDEELSGWHESFLPKDPEVRKGTGFAEKGEPPADRSAEEPARLAANVLETANLSRRIGKATKTLHGHLRGKEHHTDDDVSLHWCLDRAGPELEAGSRGELLHRRGLRRGHES